MTGKRYRFMTEQDLYDIYRRWKAGQTVSEIARQEQRDRKTVRPPIQYFEEKGLDKEEILSQEEFRQKCPHTRPSKKKNGGSILEKYKDELYGLINGVPPNQKDGMKPKTAFEVVVQRHDLAVSYSSFKRFSRKHGLKNAENSPTIRIETEPGEAIQLDYGKTGMLDFGGKKKTVYAFIGILAHSRLPFIEFTHSQSQQSFIESNINMLEYYGGAPKSVSLDNLKSGVIKADLYDPKLNQAYSEFAEYYGVFLDPCRVRKPKDKGKVERMVPVARELFRKLRALYPEAALPELNRKAVEWCRKEYGTRKHGTTGMDPVEVFETLEKVVLARLPEERFTAPVWKRAKAHPDQFVQFEKKRYSLPAKYRGEEVWVRRTGSLVKIFFHQELVRQFTVPKGNSAYEKTDFPEHTREMLAGGYPKYLLDRSKQYGEEAYQLILQILSVHANLNCRRALGFIGIMEKHYGSEYFSEVCGKAKSAKITAPKIFQHWMECEKAKEKPSSGLFEVSEAGMAMTRNTDYYFH